MAPQQILPIVKQLKQKIDTSFINYMGPAGEQICAEQWELLTTRGKIRPSSLFSYSTMLSSQLTNKSQIKAFNNDVNAILKFS
ncbi:hypothetical protein [Marinicellulosiphila megalodicopiae]|uniref:hypothetical protein n=1 Tax=Marinicellulosiphila megalodicopiae TaxID=2724896 RepID=UPI003BB060A7